MCQREGSGQMSGNWYLSEAAPCDRERYKVKCLGTDISVGQHYVTERGIRSSVWELISQWGSTMWLREVLGQVSWNWYLSETVLCDREWYQVKCLGTDFSVRQHYVTENGIRSSVWELISQWGSTMWQRMVSGQVSGNWYLSEAALCDREWYQSSVWELISQWDSTVWPRLVSDQVSGNSYLSEAALCDLERYQVKCLGTYLSEAALCDRESLHSQVKCLGTNISVRQHYVTENDIRSSVWELISQWCSTMW